MDLRSHLQLYRRHWIAIILLTLITGAAAYLFGIQKASHPYETTLFISLGVEEAKTGFTENSPYDNAQAADNFTETVQGWFKNPDLIAKIEDKAREDVDIGARRQEKQNLVITFDAESEQKSQEIAEIAKGELEQEINEYNVNTGSHFTIALSGSHSQKNSSRTIIFGLVGTVLGFLLGLAFAYLSEELFGSKKTGGIHRGSKTK